MKNVQDDILNAFIQACRDMAERGLVRCSSGNLSLRLDNDRLLATSSRSWLESASMETVSVCRISDGALLDGPKPTVEIEFHAKILKTRPDMNVIMHFQTPYATTLACRNQDDINYFVIPEIPFYIGQMARVPYLTPGSKELAEAVTNAMQDHDMVVMENHGIVTASTDYAHAIQNAEFFELACEIIVHGGDTLKPIPENDVKTLLELRQAAARGV